MAQTENGLPPATWQAAMDKVLAGTEFVGYVRYFERWGFVGNGDADPTPHEHDECFHVTVTIPGYDDLVGSGATVEAAAEAARSRVESHLEQQKGE